MVREARSNWHLCRQIRSCMVKLTKHGLQKLEALYSELGYVIRYEKGNFNSGYCLVEDRKIVVINKFFDTEGRMTVLLDILDSLAFDEAALSEKSAKYLTQLQRRVDEEAKEDSGS